MIYVLLVLLSLTMLLSVFIIMVMSRYHYLHSKSSFSAESTLGSQENQGKSQEVGLLKLGDMILHYSDRFNGCAFNSV